LTDIANPNPGSAATTRPSSRAIHEGPSSLSSTTLFGFSLGMIGERIFRDAPALLLLFYMTDYLAIPPALAGIAILIPKLLIVFVDPLVGTLSDRLSTPWGRRRPLMLAGGLLTSLSMVMFFHAPHFGNAMAQASYMSLMILVGFSGYSLFSVPYLTMGSEIAANDGERRKVMSWRIVFMAIGLTVSAYAGGLVQAVGGGLRGYAIMGWIFAAVCLATMLVTVISTGRIATAQGGAERLSILQQIRVVTANRRYVRLLLVCFAQKIGEGIGYSSFAFFCVYVVHQPLSAIGLVVLASCAGQVLAQPFWLWASRRWRPQTLYIWGALGWCLNLILWLGMKDQSQLWLIPLGLQGGIAAGGFQMVTLGMLSNTMAADVEETGFNREGVYSGAWLATEKLAFALGAAVVGEFLALFGFMASANGVHAHQTATAIFGIALTYCGLNMIVYLASILAMRRVGDTSAVTA
jgi:GPH family glycoside/pentoside/hexuronide:cation symporter